MKICWKFTHPQVNKDIYEFVSSLEQIWRNSALRHLLNERSSAVNGFQTDEKNITIIHK